MLAGAAAGGEELLCPKAGGEVDAPAPFNGKLECPAFAELCSSVEYSTCPNDCSGQGSCIAGSCFCLPGRTGKDCSTTICENNCNADKWLGYCTSHSTPPKCWCRHPPPVTADCRPLLRFTDGLPLMAVLPAPPSANFSTGSTNFSVANASTVRVAQGGEPLGGTFTLSLPRASDGALESTAPLPFDASQWDVRDALEALGGGIDSSGANSAVDVTTSRHMDGGTTWRITFYGRIGDVPPLVANVSALRGESAALHVTEAFKGTALAGSFRISAAPLALSGSPLNASAFGAHVFGTEALPHDASAAQVTAALASLGLGEALVSRADALTHSIGEAHAVAM